MVDYAEHSDLVIEKHESGNRLRLTNKICHRFGLTHVRGPTLKNPGDLSSILSAAARFYGHLNHSAQAQIKVDGINPAQVECIRLTESSPLNGQVSILVPHGEQGNINRYGHVFIDTSMGGCYGYTIFNNLAFPLYAALFYFNPGNLSISNVHIVLPKDYLLTALNYSQHRTISQGTASKETSSIPFLRMEL